MEGEDSTGYYSKDFDSPTWTDEDGPQITSESSITKRREPVGMLSSTVLHEPSLGELR